MMGDICVRAHNIFILGKAKVSKTWIFLVPCVPDHYLTMDDRIGRPTGKSAAAAATNEIESYSWIELLTYFCGT